MRVNFPFDSMGLLETTASDLAWSTAMAFLHLQASFPDRPNPVPVEPRKRKMMVLKFPEKEGALQPSLSLTKNLQGEWKEMDAQELGEGAVLEDFGRCSMVVLELVDSLRAV